MSTDAIFSALGSGGLVAVLLALVAWARSRGKDEADVAKAWASTVDSALTRANEQADHLNRRLLEALETLDECERKIRILNTLSREMVDDLEYHGVETADYRRRLKAV